MKSHSVRFVLSGVLMLAVGAAVLACGSGRSGGADTGTTQLTDAAAPARPLAAGPGVTGGSRLPDCSHYQELTGKSDEPVEGKNCVKWDILSQAPGLAALAHSVVVAEVLPDVRAYQVGPKKAEPLTCSFTTADGPESVSLSVVPVEFSPVEWIKGSKEEVSAAVINGQCAGDGSFSCFFASPNGEWNVGPGLNLLLMNVNCCPSQYKPGSQTITAIYPIQDGMLYDWDGTAYPLTDVVAAMKASETMAGMPAVADNPCPSPVPVDTPDAVISESETSAQ